MKPSKSCFFLFGVMCTIAHGVTGSSISPGISQQNTVYANTNTPGTFATNGATFSYTPQAYPTVPSYYGSSVSPVIPAYTVQGQGQTYNAQFQAQSTAFASPVTQQQQQYVGTRSEPGVAGSGYAPTHIAHQTTGQSSAVTADGSSTTSQLSKHDQETELSSLLLEFLALVVLPLIFIPSFVFVLLYLWQFLKHGGQTQYPSGDEFFSYGPFGIGQLHKKKGQATTDELIKEKADELIARVLPHI